MKTFLTLLFTHALVLLGGFLLGIYLLPVLTAPPAPSDEEIAASMKEVIYSASFTRELPGSDFLHWGQGAVSITAGQVAFVGELAPGPDYQLYLTRELVLDEESFLAVKADAARIGPVRSFNNFLLDIPPGVDPADYAAVVIWCESFGEFITAGQYRG